MSERYVQLIGAEQVQSAGNTISSAAREMREAASSIDDTMRRHQQFLDDWLSRFEQIITQATPKGDAAPPAA